MGCLLYNFAYALNISTPVYQVSSPVGKRSGKEQWRAALCPGCLPDRPWQLVARTVACPLQPSWLAPWLGPPQDNFVTAGNVAVHLAKTAGEPGPRAFLTGHELMKSCYYRNATEHWVVCPNQFPCKCVWRGVARRGCCVPGCIVPAPQARPPPSQQAVPGPAPSPACA